MERLKNIHKVGAFMEEFLIPLNISTYRLSNDRCIPQTRISEIINGKRRVTGRTAFRFSKYFGTFEKFWLGLQDDYDLEEEYHAAKNDIELIKHFTPIKAA